MVSAPEAQGNRSTRGRGWTPWACPLSARETFATPWASTSVSDWLFFLGRCVSCKLNYGHKMGPERDLFFNSSICMTKSIFFLNCKVHLSQKHITTTQNRKKNNLLYKYLAKFPMHTMNPINAQKPNFVAAENHLILQTSRMLAHTWWQGPQLWRNLQEIAATVWCNRMSSWFPLSWPDLHKPPLHSELLFAP